MITRCRVNCFLGTLCFSLLILIARSSKTSPLNLQVIHSSLDDPKTSKCIAFLCSVALTQLSNNCSSEVEAEGLASFKISRFLKKKKNNSVIYTAVLFYIPFIKFVVGCQFLQNVSVKA